MAGVDLASAKQCSQGRPASLCRHFVTLAVTLADLPAHLPSKLTRTHASWFVHVFICWFTNHARVKPLLWVSQNVLQLPCQPHTCKEPPNPLSLPHGVSELLRAVNLLPEIYLSSSLVLGNLNPAQGRVLTLENHVVLLRSKSSQ